MELKYLTLDTFCADTASSLPAPGGGGVAALVGALAAALAQMVASLTIGKPGFEDAEAEMRRLAADCEALRRELLDAVTGDKTSFEAYLAALQLPKATEEEKALRRSALQSAAKDAAAAPLAVAEAAAKVLPIAKVMVCRGNPNVVTDGLIAAMLARTAVQSALLNVKVNLPSIKDARWVSAASARAGALTAQAAAAEAEILALSPLCR